MNIQRAFNHFLFMPWKTRRAFPSQSLQAIKQAIQTYEQQHQGELCFAVEGSLDCWAVLKGETARERAIALFSQLRLWDTTQNSGVLIYVLLADRAVEIVVDRGILACAGELAWGPICHDMEQAFSRSEFQQGALAGVASVAQLLAQHFPAHTKLVNELPDEPFVLN